MRTSIAMLGAVIAIGVQAQAQDWKPADGPLKTRWAKDVTEKNALPEYPRPQMVRKDWLNLNGLWDLKLADGTALTLPEKDSGNWCVLLVYRGRW